MLQLRYPLALLALLAVCACSERPTLLIELRHPRSLDPIASSGTLKVQLLHADTGVLQDERQLATTELGGRKRLFEGLDLEPGKRYQLRLELQFDPQEAACSSTGRRALGLSGPFDYEEDLERLGVYLDCVDTASATGSPLGKRVYHSATWVPTDAPEGEVLVVGGAESGSAIDNVADIKLFDSLERFDPLTGEFSLLDSQLSHPRMGHRATLIASGDVLISAGLVIVETAGSPTLLALPRVERVRQGRVAPLFDLVEKRGLHGAAVVGDRFVVAGGVDDNFGNPRSSVEIHDLQGSSPPIQLTMKVPRLSMALVPLDDRRVLISGGIRASGWDIKDELVCLSGSCGCGKPPCIEELAFGYGAGLGRYGVTGTRVDCKEPGKGAVYLVGGSYEEGAEPNTTTTFFDDIYCVDLEQPQVLLPVGRLERSRSGHTATLISGPGRTPRLVVAGGSGSTTAGKDALWNTAEILDVSCACQKVSSLGEIKLQGMRSGHTATLLPDGTILLVGGIFVGSGAERINIDR